MIGIKYQYFLAQLVVAAEYTDCISAEESDFPNECPRYDTKQSNSETPVILELWGMWSILSLLLLPGLFWPEVVALEKVLFMHRIELFYF